MVRRAVTADRAPNGEGSDIAVDTDMTEELAVPASQAAIDSEATQEVAAVEAAPTQTAAAAAGAMEMAEPPPKWSEWTPYEMIRTAFQSKNMNDPFEKNASKNSWHPIHLTGHGDGAPMFVWMQHNDLSACMSATGVLFTDELTFCNRKRGDKVETHGVQMGKGRVNEVKKGAMCFVNVKPVSGKEGVMLCLLQKFMTVIYGKSIVRELARRT